MTNVDALLEELLADHRASCFVGLPCGTSEAVEEAKRYIRSLEEANNTHACIPCETQ